jgi:hypothetical protein
MRKLDWWLRVFLAPNALHPLMDSPSLTDAIHRVMAMPEVEQTGRLAMLGVALGAVWEIVEIIRRKPPDDTPAGGTKSTPPGKENVTAPEDTARAAPLQ